VQTLRDVVQALDELDDEGTIYTNGTSPAARATAHRRSGRSRQGRGLAVLPWSRSGEGCCACLERMARVSAADHRRQAHGDRVLRDTRRLPTLDW